MRLHLQCGCDAHLKTVEEAGRRRRWRRRRRSEIKACKGRWREEWRKTHP
jgi:hypothetical protein